MTRSATFAKFLLAVIGLLFSCLVYWLIAINSTGILISELKSELDIFIVEEHNGRASAKIIKTDGTLVHQWTFNEAPTNSAMFRYALPLVDGGLIGLLQRSNRKGFNYIVHLSKKNEVTGTLKGNFHHQFQILPGNKILALSKETIPSPNSKMFKNSKVRIDSILEMDWKGKTYWSWSTKDHYNELLRLADVGKPVTGRDWTHLNSIQKITKDLETSTFKEGDVLVSSPTLNLIFLLARDTGNIKWSWHDPKVAAYQHAVRLQKDGKILLLDNRSQKVFSRILKLDPESRSIEVVYERKGLFGFFAVHNGAVVPYQDGYLITNSLFGYAKIVNEDSETIWEYRTQNINLQSIYSKYRLWLKTGNPFKLIGKKKAMNSFVYFAMPVPKFQELENSEITLLGNLF